MLNLSELKNELIGFEGSCLELDSKLVGLGFYSEIDNYNDELINNKCVYYVSEEDSEEGVMIEFEVVIGAGEDEVVVANELKIIDVRTI